jgi:hypothetical protein
MRDPEFGAVRVTAFGIYAMKIKDPTVFIREVAGTDSSFSTDEIQENLKGKIGMRIKEVMPELAIPVIDLESKVIILGEMLKERIAPAFEALGLELVEVQVQDVGLPEEVERAIDKAGAMKIIGNMQTYTQYETASSINDAANNPGGLAAAGVGIGMGFGMGAQMGTVASGAGSMPGFSGGAPSPPVPGPPPLPLLQFFIALNGQQAGPFDLAAMQQMVTSGQLTRETLVWRQGMAGWTTADTVADLALVLKQAV